MKKKSAGGQRDGAGRPKIESGEQKRRNITLSDRFIEKAREIGDGNVSSGIRKALEAYKATI